MANAWRILGGGVHAVNRSPHRASGSRVLGKLGGRPVLLITMAGRKTGNLYTNPVLYLEDAGRLCGDRLGQWVCRRALVVQEPRSTREAEIEIWRQKLAVAATVATGEQRDILWRKLVAGATCFAQYQRKVEQIPMAILMPRPDGLPIMPGLARSFAFRTRSR